MAKTPRKPQAGPRPKTPDAKGRVTNVRYSREVGEEICERIALGEAWLHIANTEGMPSYSTLYEWCKKHSWLADRLAVAREFAADSHADRALEVAEQTTPETLQADRLRVSTLLKRAAIQMGKNREQAARDAEARRQKQEAERVAAQDNRPVEVIFRVRHFEKYVGEDGRPYVREIPRRDDEDTSAVGTGGEP